MIILKEDYLDAEKQFYDFRTKPLTDEVVFDMNTTGTSYYNDFINDPKYMVDEKNLKSEIVWMTPMEYFEGCANIFNSTAEKQISQTKLDKNTFDHLMTVLKKYKKTFPIGHLNYADEGQEGRHRMLVAAEYSGWDVKQPVLVINWADEERHNREETAKAERDAYMKIRNACTNALHYKFGNIEELKHQIQSELNNQYGVCLDDPDVEFTLTTDEDAQEFVVTCNGGSYSFGYDYVKWDNTTSEDNLDDIDWEDLGIDEEDLDNSDLDSWLKKYLGESWPGPTLAEAIEKHDTLNPALWEGESLKEDVKGAIKEIVERYVEDSEILSMKDIIDIELLGSNASYNYTSHSDMDIHLVVNMESISSDPALVQIACNAEKALFNKAYEFTIKGVEVEMYVEDVKAATASNGIFSVTKDEWIKKPEQIDIPDVTEDEDYLKLLDIWMIKAKKTANSTSSEEVQQFINELYNLRRLSIMTDGEYALGNLVFKEIRNAGLLQELKDLVNKLASKELSLESLQ